MRIVRCKDQTLAQYEIKRKIRGGSMNKSALPPFNYKTTIFMNKNCITSREKQDRMYVRGRRKRHVRIVADRTLQFQLTKKGASNWSWVPRLSTVL